MKKNVTVQFYDGSWCVFDGNRRIGSHIEKVSAELHAHHYRYAPSLQKKLKLKKSADHDLCGRPFYGVWVEINKTENGNWNLYVEADGNARGNELFKTRRAALQAVAKIGNEKVMTHNILNPDFGEFEISRSEKGGCTDPGTETYHCM